MHAVEAAGHRNQNITVGEDGCLIFAEEVELGIAHSDTAIPSSETEDTGIGQVRSVAL